MCTKDYRQKELVKQKKTIYPHRDQFCTYSKCVYLVWQFSRDRSILFFYAFFKDLINNKNFFHTGHNCKFQINGFFYVFFPELFFSIIARKTRGFSYLLHNITLKVRFPPLSEQNITKERRGRLTFRSSSGSITKRLILMPFLDMKLVSCDLI